jgi:hypothetical protein
LLRKKKAQKCRQRIPVSKMTSVILLFQVWLSLRSNKNL